MESKAKMMGFSTPPSLDDLTEIAEEIVDELPKELNKYIGKLKIEVEEFPDEYIEAELELESEFDLLGCYQSSGPAAIGKLPVSGKGNNRRDVLYLYRRPILDAWCETGDDLTMLVNRVILQEIGTHFGFTESEIEILEEDMVAEYEDQLIVCE